jgi:hypothetical protein
MVGAGNQLASRIRPLIISNVRVGDLCRELEIKPRQMLYALPVASSLPERQWVIDTEAASAAGTCGRMMPETGKEADRYER